MRWLIGLWRQRQRSIDLRILWPVCKELAPDLDHAKAVFAMHAFHDRAWLCLGDAEIRRRINELSLCLSRRGGSGYWSGSRSSSPRSTAHGWW